MGSFGTTEIILIVAVLFLLFGATRLPQLAKSLGQSKKAFKEGLREAELEDDEESKRTSPVTPPQINQVSDERADEVRRRSEAKTT